MPDAVYLTRPPSEHFDIIFLPGTKNTIEDMLGLRSTGFERWLQQELQSGAKLVGICGGFQMLGERITDPDATESGNGSIRGLGFLPLETRLAREKTTRKVAATTLSGIAFSAYAIHMGITTSRADQTAFATLQDGGSEGVRTSQIAGTYLHGALENKAVLEELLGAALPTELDVSKDVQYDRLADWFADHVDHQVFQQSYLKAESGVRGA